MKTSDKEDNAICHQEEQWELSSKKISIPEESSYCEFKKSVLIILH